MTVENIRRQLYTADYLLLPYRRIEKGAVLVENGNIIAVGGLSSFSIEDRIDVVEIGNAYITPGFIDTHIHGAGGFDASAAADSPRGIAAMSDILARRGVTSFFPTVVSLPRDRMLDNLAFLSEAMDAPMPGAVPVGINIEGPFINPQKRGAQDELSLSVVDLGFARELLAAAGGKAKVMTFAPELPDADKLASLLAESGVIPSMGHSLADERQTLRAIDAGASLCTHLFNGMQPLHQRSIGLAGVALTDERVGVELIIDGRHVDSRMVALACRCKRTEKLIGISDCTMAAGMPNGNYHIGNSPIMVRDGFSQTSSGVLAGTTTMLDTGWHELVSGGNLGELEAAQTVTCNPAIRYGLSDRGIILPNRRADLAFYECGTNRPLMTVCCGKAVSCGEA